MGYHDRISMSQGDRDRLTALAPLLRAERSQVEAARLLGLSVRQVRRLQRRLEEGGDAALVHRLRGRPSNHRHCPQRRAEVLAAYRARLSGFGPTLASEKLAEQGLAVSAETLRQWLLAEGLWQKQRRREVHRQRRPRRECFGELVQMDASWHDWTEGRGEAMVLVAMIDDATSRVAAGFYESETVASYFDLVHRWLQRHGRPVALYTDRDSIFEWQSKGRAAEGLTQFGRAMQELDVRLILAYSPQAKGRVERLFGTAQDRWVKELRLAGVTTRVQADALLRRVLVPQFNRRFAVPPARGQDGHRELGPGMDLEAILSWQSERVVANDYTVRLHNRHYQLLGVVPGLRGGRVIMEERRDGRLAIRFRGEYLRYRGVGAGGGSGVGAGEPSPSAGPSATPAGSPYRPAADHPWRKGWSKQR